MTVEMDADAAGCVTRFRQVGFVRLPTLSDAAELAWLTSVFERLVASRVGARSFRDLAAPASNDAAPKLPQILKPEVDVPELLDTAAAAGARAWAATLLDTPVADLDYFGHIILKPAHDGVPTPWHQDEAYWDPRWQRRGVTIWMPLRDATLDNGCLQFVPGSHLRGVGPHRHIGGDDDVEGLEVVNVPTENIEPCPLPAGAVSAHHVRTLHYADGNRTEHSRWAYIHVFSTRAEQVDTPTPRPWLA